MLRRPLLLTVCLLVCLSWTAAPAAAAGNLVMQVQVPQDSAQFTYLNIQPNGVAVDASGNFFVSNAWNSSIQKFNPNGHLLLQFGSYGNGGGQFNSPAGVAVDGQGNIYVADTGNHRVQKFDATGQFLLQWNSYLGATFQSNSPQDLALDSEGYVYVADPFNGFVVKFDSSGNYQNYWMPNGPISSSRYGLVVVGTGPSQCFYMVDAVQNTFCKYSSFSSSKLWEVGSSGSGSGEFSSPQGVAMDGSGNFYVADQGNNRIQIFNSSGAYQGQWSLGSFPAYFDSGPMGVALDGSGNVYVANTNANQLLKFDSSHTLVTTWGMTGTGNGQFFFPYGAAVDSQGNFYVADTYNNRVQKFDAAGHWLANFGSGLANFYPLGVAVDAEDNLWVADPTSLVPATMDQGGIIREFDSGGNLLRTWSTPFASGSPHGLALDNNGHIYVTMEFFWVKPSSYIMKFDLQGQLLDIWPIPNGVGLSYGLALDGQGNVYAGYTPYPSGPGGCVLKFNSSGAVLANWGGGISGFSPYGLALDAAGNLYVSDIGPAGGWGPGSGGPGSCIRMFDPNGNNVATWTNYSPNNGQFLYPAGLALSGRKLYVADNRTLVLNLPGTGLPWLSLLLY